MFRLNRLALHRNFQKREKGPVLVPKNTNVQGTHQTDFTLPHIKKIKKLTNIYGDHDVGNKRNNFYCSGNVETGVSGVSDLIGIHQVRTKKYDFMKPEKVVARAVKCPVNDLTPKAFLAAAGHGFTIIAGRKMAKRAPFLAGTGVNTSNQLGRIKSFDYKEKAAYDRVYKKGRDGGADDRIPFASPDMTQAKDFKYLYTFSEFETKLDQNSHINSIAAGRQHSAVVQSNNKVHLFGNNTLGQCGSTRSKDHVHTSLTGLNDFGGEYIHEVICGLDHTIFLTAETPVDFNEYASRIEAQRRDIEFNVWEGFRIVF